MKSEIRKSLSTSSTNTNANSTITNWMKKLRINFSQTNTTWIKACNLQINSILMSVFTIAKFRESKFFFKCGKLYQKKVYQYVIDISKYSDLFCSFPLAHWFISSHTITDLRNIERRNVFTHAWVNFSQSETSLRLRGGGGGIKILVTTGEGS